MPQYKNDDYLRYDAESIKSLIIKKLTEDNSVFTDYLFEGSNLTTMIDVFAQMYQTLIYYTNHGASEAMFSDSNFYENMNRIVKMLGYSPNGYKNPSIEVQLLTTIETVLTGVDANWTTFNTDLTTLPKYTTFDTGKTDSLGAAIKYSLTSNTALRADGNGMFTTVNNNRLNLTNGVWKKYPTLLTAVGIPFESFELTQISLDSKDTDTYERVSHPFIDVFVRRDSVLTQYKTIYDGTLYEDEITNSVNNSAENVVQVRINERKRYEFTFGDDIHGTQLKEGDEIVVVYLKGNGSEAEIGIDAFSDSITNGATVEINVEGGSSILSELLTTIIGSDDITTVGDPIQTRFATVGIKPTVVSSKAGDVESVEEIRNNAPNHYRSGGRLVSKADFKNFMFSRFAQDVYDVTVMNNAEYLSKFFAWLYSIRDCSEDGGNRLKTDIKTYGYPFSDACDFNNVYLWTKFKTSNSIDSSIILREMDGKKCLTSEPVILNAVDTYFVPCLDGAFGEKVNGEYPKTVGSNGYDYRYYNPVTNITGWDSAVENFIEITKDVNSSASVEKIKKSAEQTITNFFSPSNLSIGGKIDLSKLHTDLLNINGVASVGTVHETKVDGVVTNRVAIDGLSFAYWTEDLVTGEDKAVFKGVLTLQPFQFANLASDTHLQLSKRIKVKYDILSNSVEI